MNEEYPTPETAAPAPQTPHAPAFGQKKPSNAKRWLVIGGIVLLLLAALGAAYWFLLRPDTAPPPAAQSAAKDTSNTEEAGTAPQANATTKTFKSTLLNIEFTYRSDWKVAEADGKKEVVITSPRVTYAGKDGASKQGVFTLKLRNGVISEEMQSTVHNAIAVKNSEVIAYDAPTEAQRQYTNVSFGGPDAGNFGFVIVSGSVEYKAGQPFGSQINLFGNSYLFVGGYGQDANDTLAFDAVPATSFDSDAYQQALAIVKSLKIY